VAFFRKALLASTIAAAGLASTTGMAFAQEGHGQEGGDRSLVNAQGTDVLNQASACDIDADVLNVLPIDEVTANLDLPVLNKTGDGNDQGKVPNGKNTCTPESKSGAVDSSDSSTDDATEGTTSTGSRD
jgi:hypothetical protein